MYLWDMVLKGKDVKFSFTEHTTEKEKNNYLGDVGYYVTDQTYQQDDVAIKPVVEAAFNLLKALNIDLTNPMDGIFENAVLIKRGFKSLVLIYHCGVFDARLEEGNIVAKPENGWKFTKEQYIAIFDFLEILKETNWFF